MLTSLLALGSGLALLAWSAERFVDAAVHTAQHLRLSPLVIGTLVVGIGTSAPEFLVSGLAAFNDRPGLAVGNAYGSNISNIGLILGLAVVIAPFWVHASVVRRDLPWLMGVTLLTGWFLRDATFDRLEAIVMIALLAIFIGFALVRGRRDAVADAAQPTASAPRRLTADVVWLVAALVLLIASSQLLVWGAVRIATLLGVSDLVIGLTVVAVGTSLPELASTISALRRGSHDLVLGNVVGSNLFNTLGVVGVAALISPIHADPVVLWRDWPVMTAMTALLMLFTLRVHRQRTHLARAEGAVLLLGFVAYTGYIAAHAVRAAGAA